MTTNDPTANARWQQRYTHPRIVSFQQAFHAPERGLLVIASDGQQRLHTWHRTPDIRTPLEPARNSDFGGIMPDGKAIIYHDGDHLIRCDFNGDNPHDITPELPAFSPVSLSASLDGKTIGFTAILPDGFGLYTLHDDDAPVALYKTSAPAFGPMLSYGGEIGVIAVTERKAYGDVSLLAFNLIQVGESQSVSVLEEETGSIQPVSFAPLMGDFRLLAITNATGYQRPVIWDTNSGDRMDIPLEHIEDDLVPLGWSPDGTKILLQQVQRARYNLYIYDLDRSTFDPLTELPDGTIQQAGFVPDVVDTLLLLHESAIHPPRIVTASAQNGSINEGISHNTPADGHGWRSIEFVSSGNVTVQGWLATPAGNGPFPTIIHAPTGPEAVLTEHYHADASAWVDAGFAWLGVNYRGSSTFGDAFKRAIFGMLGLRESDDLIAGAVYLIEQGVAREDALFVSGERYGGSVALLASGKRPDLWAGVMVDSPVTDWKLLHETGSEALTSHIQAMFGGHPSEFGTQYVNSSPVALASSVNAPVVIFGIEQDPNLPQTQITDYVKRLQANEDTAVAVSWSTVGAYSPVTRQLERLKWVNAVMQECYSSS